MMYINYHHIPIVQWHAYPTQIREASCHLYYITNSEKSDLSRVPCPCCPSHLSRHCSNINAAFCHVLFELMLFFVEGRSLGIPDFCILTCKCLLHKPLTGQWGHWSTASRQAGFHWKLKIIYRSNAMCAIHMCNSLPQRFSLANLVSVPLKAPCPSAEASQDQFHRFHEIQSFCIKVKLKEHCDQQH